ncbi:hypothetical protein FQN54_005637 [Arachnomyces sp. PD_36]|nr:hypothetical protein FQN54_005637 [Arachnomyces sp. PD_36]
MVLSNPIQWYILRTITRTHLFPHTFDTFDMSTQRNDSPQGRSRPTPGSSSAYYSRPPKGETRWDPVDIQNQENTNSTCTGEPSTTNGPPPKINSTQTRPRRKPFPKSTTVPRSMASTTNPSSPSNRHSTPTTTSQNNENPDTDITTDWFDVIHDDTDSESSCSSTGIEDGRPNHHDDDPDADQSPRPVSFTSFGYEFFKGAVGFLCDVLEGGGRWGGRGVRPTS